MTTWGRTALAQRTDQKVRVLQETLHRAAKADPKRTFGVLYDKVAQWEVLWLAWYRVRRNRGAPGVDGRTIEAIKASGEVRFLREIQAELRAKAYRPRRALFPRGPVLGETVSGFNTKRTERPASIATRVLRTCCQRNTREGEDEE